MTDAAAPAASPVTGVPAGRASGSFSVRTVLLLVLAGVFSLSGLAVLSAYAPDLRKGDDGQTHALSRSAVGFAGAVRMLRATDHEVLLSRGPMGANAGEGLMILSPGAHQSHKALEEVIFPGRRLIVLPKWQAAPHREQRGWVQVIGPLPPGQLGAVLFENPARVRITERAGESTPQLYRPDGTPLGPQLAPIEGLRTLSGDEWIPVVVDETGSAVLAMHKETHLYVLADPDLLNTYGMKDAATATAAVGMIDVINPSGPVIFDLTLHGLARPRSLLRLALEPPLLGATLCLLAAALLVAWQAFTRFGGPRRTDRAIALGKQALADNTAGLVRLAGREASMATPFAMLTRASVVRAISPPRTLQGEELDAFLDRLAEQAGAEHRYTALAAEARAVRTPRDLITVAQKLYRWRLEMTRGRQ